MDFEVWEPYYSRILSDFGFEREEDERSALVLSNLLEDKDLASEDDLRDLILGKSVAVVGGARHLEKELEEDLPYDVLIAADGTTSLLLKRAICPDVIVTDLDGNIEDQLAANRQGAIAAVHAHGDNISQIKAFVPRFTGKVMGTVQCRPFDDLHNFGGFTDGDRSVFLAEHFNAESIRLLGFDFYCVGEKENCNHETKLRKLGWARRLIAALDCPIEHEGLKDGLS
ncbi:MAG: DUF115 domain-containing protein [Thermoplasmata archaeon]|nr:MAG: DUF115 domain-containing protein [Thermoplasmata archaeon]